MISRGIQGSFLCLIFLFSSVLSEPCACDPCAPVKVRDCPGVAPNPKATLIGVYIQDCEVQPCSFKRSDNVSMEMDIEFHGDVFGMKAKLFAIIGGIELPWGGVPENACDFIVSEGDCPFKADDYITYGVHLFVDPVAPPIRVDVKYMIKDENDEDLICWIVNAQVSG